MASAWKYKRKDSPFWWIGFYTNGKKGKPFSCKIKNERQAELYRKDYERELTKKENEQLVRVPENAGMLFSEAFELYKQDRRNSGKELTEGTITTFKIAFKHLYGSCGDKPVYKYTREDFNIFVRDMDNLKQNSRATNAVKVNAVFNFLVKEKYLNENPFKHIQAKWNVFEVLSDAQIKTIREYASQTKFADLVDFQLLTAFRLDEAKNVNAKNIKDGRIMVKAKGGHMRSIPISDELKIWLDNYYRKMNIAPESDELLFKYKRHCANEFWRRVNKNCGLKKGIASHALRKYTLSKMANAGIPINFVKEYAGHTDIKTTLKYYIKNDLDKIAQELNNKIKILDNKG
jgi:integrase/recombinase XerD